MRLVMAIAVMLVAGNVLVSEAQADGYIRTRALSDRGRMGVVAPKPAQAVVVKDTQRVVDKLTQEQREALLKVIAAWEKDTKSDMTELRRIIKESLEEQQRLIYELEQKVKKAKLEIKVD